MAGGVADWMLNEVVIAVVESDFRVNAVRDE